MANHRAIAATSAALAGLIRDHYPRAEFGSGLEVRLYQKRDFEEPMLDGFSVCLYRIAVNGSVRNLTLRRSPDGRRFRPSLPLDLHYMITPWVMRLMEDTGTLSAGHLNHYLAETDTFAPHEAIDLVCDPLALADYLTLWDRLQPRLPASATYTLRMVFIDSDVRVDDGAPVQTRRFDVREVVT
jgi:Pvc16 N-terminal domain